MTEQQEQLPDDQEQARHWVDNIPPAALLGGFGLVSYGAWLIYDPLGFIVAGVLLLALGIKGAQP